MAKASTGPCCQSKKQTEKIEKKRNHLLATLLRSGSKPPQLQPVPVKNQTTKRIN